MSRDDARPLLDEAEGRDQDERTQLVASVMALLRQSDRRQVTDLHVLELCKWVHRLDRAKSGALLSHQEIARGLLVELSTARSIVRRATDDLGILLKVEQRYVSGGQNANRYEVNWPLVRAISRGEHTTREPGVTMYQPPVTTWQGAVTRRHPYKETTGILPEPLNTEPPPPNKRLTESKEEEVHLEKVSQEAQPLVLVRTERKRPTASVARLVDAYERAGVYGAGRIVERMLPRVGQQYLEDVLGYWIANASQWDGPGALKLRLERSLPELAIDRGWPPARTTAARPRPKDSAEVDRQRAEYERAKAEARAAAEADVPLAEQLRRARDAKLNSGGDQ